MGVSRKNRKGGREESGGKGRGEEGRGEEKREEGQKGGGREGQLASLVRTVTAVCVCRAERLHLYVAGVTDQLALRKLNLKHILL